MLDAADPANLMWSGIPICADAPLPGSGPRSTPTPIWTLAVVLAALLRLPIAPDVRVAGQRDAPLGWRLRVGQPGGASRALGFDEQPQLQLLDDLLLRRLRQPCSPDRGEPSALFRGLLAAYTGQRQLLWPRPSFFVSPNGASSCWAAPSCSSWAGCSSLNRGHGDLLPRPAAGAFGLWLVRRDRAALRWRCWLPARPVFARAVQCVRRCPRRPGRRPRR